MTPPAATAHSTSVAAPGIPTQADAGGVRSVPGWALRLVLGGAAVAASLIVMLAEPRIDAPGVLQVFLLLASIGTALAPGSVLPLAVMIGVVLFRLASHVPVLDGTLLALVALLPLVHQLAGMCAAVPARSDCLWRALRPAMVRYAMAVVPVEVAVAAVLAFG